MKLRIDADPPDVDAGGPDPCEHEVGSGRVA